MQKNTYSVSMLCLVALKQKVSEVRSKCFNMILHCPFFKYRISAFVRHEYRNNGPYRCKYHLIDANYLSIHLVFTWGFEARYVIGVDTTHARVFNEVEEPPVVVPVTLLRLLSHGRCQDAALATRSHACWLHKGPDHEIGFERLPVKAIVRIVGISVSLIQLFVDQNLKFRPVRRLPMRRCFDEFRSTYGISLVYLSLLVHIYWRLAWWSNQLHD